MGVCCGEGTTGQLRGAGWVGCGQGGPRAIGCTRGLAQPRALLGAEHRFMVWGWGSRGCPSQERGEIWKQPLWHTWRQVEGKHQLTPNGTVQSKAHEQTNEAVSEHLKYGHKSQHTSCQNKIEQKNPP